MPDDVRYERAMRAVGHMLEGVQCPLWAITPQALSQLVYAVLGAMYMSEKRLAERPGPLLCLGCFRSLEVRPHDAGKEAACPGCGKRLRLPGPMELN